MKVPPALIKRLKHHFHPVPEYSAELVLGCNGFVWVHERKAGADSAEGGDDAGAAPMQQDDAGWGKESEKAPVGALAASLSPGWPSAMRCASQAALLRPSCHRRRDAGEAVPPRERGPGAGLAVPHSRSGGAPLLWHA